MSATREPTGVTIPRFIAWMFVGALGMLSVLGVLTIGIFVLPFVGLALWLAIRRGGANAAAWGALTGAGLLPLFVAWINRDGPGNVCHQIRNGESCTEEMSPWPWFAVGMIFVLVGVGLFAHARRRTNRVVA